MSETTNKAAKNQSDVSRSWTNKFLLFGLLILLLALFLISLNLGASHASALELFSGDETSRYLLFQIRWPRSLAAVCVGGALGLSGVFLQVFLNNPLAEPYTLGLSGGATLGAVLAVVILPMSGSVGISMGSIVGCWLMTGIVLVFLRTLSASSRAGLILIGVMLSLFCGSFVSLILVKMDPSQLQKAMSWMIGYLGTDRDQHWIFLAPVLALAGIWSFWRALSLDRWLLGEEWAMSLGVDIPKMKIEILIFVTLLTSLSVAISGLIGFVGLLAPHLAQGLFRTRRVKWQVPAAFFIGGSLLLFGDILGRWIGGDSEIPAGSLVALIGAPTLIYLIFKRNRYAN